LTAALLTGQDAAALPVMHDGLPAAGCDGCQGDASPGFMDRVRGCRLFNRDCDGCDRPGFFQRLQGRFRSMMPWCCGDGEATCANGSCGNGNGIHESMPGLPPLDNKKMPSMSMAEPPLAETAALGLAKNKAKDNIKMTTAAKPDLTTTNFQTSSNPAKALSPRMAEKVGHEADYSWVTGQISREGSKWVIRYATPETVDRFNGSFTIIGSVDGNKIRSGDLVTIHGQPIGSGNAALYRANSVDLIEHE
jgi:hypothetical protein